jgi:hypothetical protein
MARTRRVSSAIGCLRSAGCTSQLLELMRLLLLAEEETIARD